MVMEATEAAGTVESILANKGREVYSIAPGAMVLEALKLMAEKNVGALVVLNEGRAIGVISERDYARKVILLGKHSSDTEVREIISGELITVAPTSTVQDCMHLMIDHRVRHLPVLEQDRVVGLVSIGDLVNWIINVQSATISQLQSYISGEYHH